MNSENQAENDLSEELRQLGVNLKQTLQSAWESGERKKVQKEIESGLKSLGEEIRKSVDDLDETIGEEVMAEVEEVRKKIEDREVAERMRGELLTVLQSINSQLQDVQTRWAPPDGEADAPNRASADEGS